MRISSTVSTYHLFGAESLFAVNLSRCESECDFVRRVAWEVVRMCRLGRRVPSLKFSSLKPVVFIFKRLIHIKERKRDFELLLVLLRLLVLLLLCVSVCVFMAKETKTKRATERAVVIGTENKCVCIAAVVARPASRRLSRFNFNPLVKHLDFYLDFSIKLSFYSCP